MKDNTLGPSIHSFVQMATDDVFRRMAVPEQDSDQSPGGPGPIMIGPFDEGGDVSQFPSAQAFGPTLAQKVFWQKGWSVVKATGRDHMAVPHITSEVEGQNFGLPTLQEVFTFALVMETKICLLIESTSSAILVREASELFEENPSRRLTDRDKPIRIGPLVAWVIKADSWIKSQPQTLIFNDKSGKKVATNGHNLESMLEKFRLDYPGAHLADSDPLEGLSSRDIAERTASLLARSPRLGRDLLLDPEDVEAQILWNLDASRWIEVNQRAGRWTKEGNLPSYIVQAIQKDQKDRLGEIPKVSQPGLSPAPLTGSQKLNMQASMFPMSEPQLATRETLRPLQPLPQKLELKRLPDAIPSGVGKVRFSKIPLSDDPFAAQLQAIEAIHELDDSKTGEEQILRRISALQKEKAKIMQSMEHVVHPNKVDDGRKDVEIPKTKGGVHNISKGDDAAGNFTGKVANQFVHQAQTYLAPDARYENLTKQEYIHRQANNNYLAKSPLFSSQDEVWDYLPEHTPWGPTDVQEATSMLKKAHRAEHLISGPPTKDGGGIQGSPPVDEAKEEGMKDTWQVPSGESVWGDGRGESEEEDAEGRCPGNVESEGSVNGMGG